MDHNRSKESAIARSKKRKSDQKIKKKLAKQLQARIKTGAQNRLRHENVLLKDALTKFRAKIHTGSRSHHRTTIGKHQSQLAKKAVVDHLTSSPVVLSDDFVVEVKKTKFCGTFGAISVVRLAELGVMAVCKTISQSTDLDIAAEGRVAHALGGHRFFPYCYGIILPNRLMLQMLGDYDDGLSVNNFGQIAKLVSKLQLVDLSCQLLEAISFMHQYGLLHNDIKPNNILVHGKDNMKLKVIDFGKVTLINNPYIYNLNSEQQKTYNKYHSYLAYELRNIPNTGQSVLTDTFSVGYCLKHTGYDNVDIIYDTGRRMKTQSPTDRLSIDSALVLLKKYIHN